MIEHMPDMMVIEMLQSNRISKGICWCRFLGHPIALYIYIWNIRLAIPALL